MVIVELKCKNSLLYDNTNPRHPEMLALRVPPHCIPSFLAHHLDKAVGKFDVFYTASRKQDAKFGFFFPTQENYQIMSYSSIHGNYSTFGLYHSLRFYPVEMKNMKKILFNVILTHRISSQTSAHKQKHIFRRLYEYCIFCSRYCPYLLHACRTKIIAIVLN